MKIRIRFLLLLVFGFLIIGYFLGNFWPIGGLVYSLNDEPVNKGQNFANFISVILAIFTLAAVIVALFKDEIMWNFKRVSVSADVLCDTVEEFFNESQNGRDPSVARFYNQIILKNEGGINAQDCELLVESIEFQGKNDFKSKSLNVPKKEVLISGQRRTYIPKNGGRRECDLFEITASEDPSGSKNIQFLIANNPMLIKAGIWTITFCLNMSNSTFKRYCFEIKWNGEWHEHKSNMQIEVKKK